MLLFASLDKTKEILGYNPEFNATQSFEVACTQYYENLKEELVRIISSSIFLVLGGGGSIGLAVTKEIFKRNLLKLHVVDLSENNMVELVRDIRSSYGYIDRDFQI